MKRVSKMSNRLGSCFLLLILVVQSLLSAGCCDIAEELFTINSQTPLEKFKQKHGSLWDVRWSSAGKRVTSLLGEGTRPYTGEPRDKATNFLRENSALFALKPDLSDLQVLNSRSDSFSANVEFQQVFNGLPVENGRIQVNFDKEGRVLQVISSYVPPVDSVDKVTLTTEQAFEKASYEFQRTTLVYPSKLDEQNQSDGSLFKSTYMNLAEPAKVDDVYFISDDHLRRAHRTSINTIEPLGSKELITDADTGELLQIRDFVYSASDGSGQVFIPNPVNSLANNTFTDNSFTEHVPEGSPNPYKTVRLLGLADPVEGLFSLKGPYVVVKNIQEPNIPPATATSSDAFNYLRNEPGFEDVMVYYHIDRMQRYIQEGLGFMNIMNRQIRVDPHAGKADNSQYFSTPSTRGNGDLLFGGGAIDDAEDGDVIAHEYGHAIQDNQAPGKYSVTGTEARAMGEGFGDYWAVSSFWHETIESGHEQACLMEWDTVPHCLRRADIAAMTMNAFNPSCSAHINGQIWSRTLFIMSLRLGKEITDKLILQSHFNVSDSPNVVQGAEAILTADRQIFGGSHVPALCKVFHDVRIHGVVGCTTSSPPPTPPPSPPPCR